jgi:hypothetical protein
MIKEALQFLCDLKRESLQLVRVVDHKDQVVFVNNSGDQTVVRIPPEPRSHRVMSIGDLVAAVRRWDTGHAVVWHSNDWITAVLNDNLDRRDMVRLYLQLSDAFVRVRKLAEENFDQRNFLRLLRHDLRGMIQPGLATAIAKLEVITSGKQASDVNPGRERGTREFYADMQNSGEIPDEITLSVKIYNVPGIDSVWQIRCSLEYTLPPSPVTFALRPLPDEINNALLNAQGELHELLCGVLAAGDEGDKVTVLFGEP